MLKYIVVWHNLLDGEWYGYQELHTQEEAISYSTSLKEKGFVTTIIEGVLYERARSSKKV